REARGAGALRGPGRVQDGGAGAVSVRRGVKIIWGPLEYSGAVGVLALLALLAFPAGGRADDLLAEAAAGDPAIEERVRLIAAHRLEGSAVLAADVADLEARDQARRDAGLAPTGLADDARYLAAGLETTRDAQRGALQAVLRAHPDPRGGTVQGHARAGEEGARYGRPRPRGLLRTRRRPDRRLRRRRGTAARPGKRGARPARRARGGGSLADRRPPAADLRGRAERLPEPAGRNRPRRPRRHDRGGQPLPRAPRRQPVRALGALRGRRGARPGRASRRGPHGAGGARGRPRLERRP